VSEHRPESLTTRGELWLKAGQPEPAEADFLEAVALAQKMSAKSWEVRATTSLARLLAKQGRRDGARATLADIYNWFTEGFDTRDLKDAKALLDELSVQNALFEVRSGKSRRAKVLRGVRRTFTNRLVPEANGSPKPHDIDPPLLEMDQSGRTEPGDVGPIGSGQEFVKSTPP
jgi:hypothetical protein